jgi:hypothetical protein
LKFSGKSILMPLHRGAPRAPKVRWALRWLERKRLKAEILRGIQLMHLCLMLDAFNPILATAVLEAKDLPPLVMFSLLFPCVGKLKIAGIMQAVSRALESYYQRRQLGAANSGGCLSGGRKRKPPPTLHDWSDNMCRALTRFTTHEVWQLLEQFDMLRPDGQPKMYRIYTSLKSYQKRGKRTKHKKYFLCSADTALMVLLCHMARPGGYVDLQTTFNGMPAPEMSRIVNFLLLYLIPWYDFGCDIQRFAHRFDMYAEAIADKGCTLNVINRGQRHKPQIVAFTDGTFYECCRPGGDGNKRMKLKDFEVRSL